eukprot:1745821-Rhodomonas_salina.2
MCVLVLHFGGCEHTPESSTRNRISDATHHHHHYHHHHHHHHPQSVPPPALSCEIKRQHPLAWYKAYGHKRRSALISRCVTWVLRLCLTQLSSTAPYGPESFPLRSHMPNTPHHINRRDTVTTELVTSRDITSTDGTCQRPWLRHVGTTTDEGPASLHPFPCHP